MAPLYDERLDASWCPVCGWAQLPDLVTRFPEEGDVPLLVGAPYDILYDMYVMAQMDFYNREYDNYNNSALAFNTALDEFRKEYHRRHAPLGAGYYKNLL